MVGEASARITFSAEIAFIAARTRGRPEEISTVGVVSSIEIRIKLDFEAQTCAANFVKDDAIRASPVGM